jgi:hypothetical protein
MANPNAVGSNTPDSFGTYAIGRATGVSLATVGNAVVAIPLLQGGLTNTGNLTGSGEVIIRRVTIQNPNASASLANVNITTTNDGNTSNAVVATVSLANLTAVNRFQDLTVASPYALTTTINGANTSALYVNVTNAASALVDIRIYGDTVSF